MMNQNSMQNIAQNSSKYSNVKSRINSGLVKTKTDKPNLNTDLPESPKVKRTTLTKARPMSGRQTAAMPEKSSKAPTVRPGLGAKSSST